MRKADFPIFMTYPDLVYLDNAATAQKPAAVITAVKQHYEQWNANIHRGIYDLSQEATDRFEAARRKVAEFIGAKDPAEIVFTSNTTEAINLVAYGWGRRHLKRGDIVVTSVMEHHSNLVPWMRLREELGVELVFLPLNEDYRLDYQASQGIDAARVKLIALTQASNVLGTVNPVRKIAEWFRSRGAEARLLVDAAQSVPHLPVDVQKLGADWVAFSAHKMLGPSGVGVLWARREAQDEMEPMLLGGHMIATVTQEKATWAPAPDKFEAGTRNIEGVIGLGAAIDYLNSVGMDKIAAYEAELTEYTLAQLQRADGLKLFGPATADARLPVFSFMVGGAHPHDVSEILNRSQVAVRAGHHCAQPLMGALSVPGTVRASMALYNTKDDADGLLRALEGVRQTLRV